MKFCTTTRMLRLTMTVMVQILLSWLIIFANGCGDNMEPSGSAVTNTGSQTGYASATFQIEWQRDQVEIQDLVSAKAIDCAAEGVATVRCEVYDIAGTWLATGGPWPCLAGSGRVERIEPGERRVFVILGEDETGNILWQGQSGEVDLEPGDYNYVGEIETSKFIPIIESYEGTGPVQLTWEPVSNAVSYRIVISSDAGFEIGTIVVNEYCTSPAILFDGNTGFDYFWKVYAIDAFGNESTESNNEIIVVDDSPNDVLPPETTITGGPASTIATSNATFYFTGSDNTTPTTDLRYSTYLIGYDSGWSSFSTEATITYSNLPDGVYTFQVSACDIVGNEDPTPAALTFTVATTASIIITYPTFNPYYTYGSLIAIEGNAADTIDISTMVWINEDPISGSSTSDLCFGDNDTWFCQVPLHMDDNVITIKAWDYDGYEFTTNQLVNRYEQP